MGSLKARIFAFYASFICLVTFHEPSWLVDRDPYNGYYIINLVYINIDGIIPCMQLELLDLDVLR